MPYLFPGLISVSLPGISTELCICQRSRLLLLLLACLSPSITIYGAKDFVSGPLVPSLHQRVTRIHVVKQSKAISSSLLSRFVDSRAGKWWCGNFRLQGSCSCLPSPYFQDRDHWFGDTLPQTAVWPMERLCSVDSGSVLCTGLA